MVRCHCTRWSAAAIGRGHLGAVERHGARVLGEHAEGDAHRGGLAGAVASDEAREPAGPDVESDIVEHAPPAVALGDPGELEHPSSLRLCHDSRYGPPAGGGIPLQTGLAIPVVRGRRTPS